MRKWFWMVVVGLFVAGVARAEGPSEGIRVSPAWLAEHLHDPGLVVLEIAQVRADYDREHIEGSRFLWVTWLAESSPEGSVEMVPAKQLDQVLSGLGIANDSKIVLCHTLSDATSAARMFVTFDRLGMGDRTYILDGGLDGWKAEGRPVTQAVPKYGKTHFTRGYQRDNVATLAFMRSAYRDTTLRVVDARVPGGYNAPIGPGAVRGGHIPGAANLPYTTLTDSLGRYLPMDSLRVRFAKAGIKPGQPLVTYCWVGRTACPVYVAARMLGYDVKLYDGSWEEWSRALDLPVEGPAAH